MTNNSDFDFAEYAEIARTDPQGFERLRQRMIDELIEQAPAARQPRLRGLQFQIDMTRRRAKTPYAACVGISRMMWDAFDGQLRPALQQILTGEANESEPDAVFESAQVIPFPTCAMQTRQDG